MEPTHTLVQITDPHLLPDGVLLRDHLDTADVLRRTLSVVEESGVRPQALLFTGDVAHFGDAATYRRFRKIVEPVAARLGAAIVVVAGNHDRRSAIREHLLDAPPDDAPLDHVVRLDGLRVIVLDTSVPGRGHGELRPAQLEWLSAELATSSPDGTVLALHHPPLPTAQRMSAAVELRPTDRSNLAAVLNGADVRLVVAGHTHVVSAGMVGGVPVWTGGTTAYSSDALAPGFGERVLLAPSTSRIDLFTDTMIVSSVPVGAETALTLTSAQVDALLDATSSNPAK